MTVDAMQHRWDVIAHECSHAVAGHIYGHAIDYIDVDRPSDGEAGRIEFKQPAAAQRLRLRRWYHERAVILRVGALVTNMDWLSKHCAWDRRQVRKIAGLLEIPVDAFEADVEVDAKEMLADSHFDVPHRALCREFRDHFHEVMPGDRSHAIMEAAIAAA